MSIKTVRNLRDWRRLRNLSQKELAEKIGVSYVTISTYESKGLGSTNIHTLSNLLEVLELNFDELDLELDKGVS